MRKNCLAPILLHSVYINHHINDIVFNFSHVITYTKNTLKIVKHYNLYFYKPKSC